MLHDLFNPLTMKLMALGHPLHEAERLAAVMVVWGVLLCTMMGFTISIAGVPEREPDNRSGSFGLSAHGTGCAGICGILSAGAGNTVGSARSLLHTQ